MADYLWRRGPESNRPTRICNHTSACSKTQVTGRQSRAWTAWGALIALGLPLFSPLAGCGGGSVPTEAPISSAQAQVAQKVEVAHLFAVVRPDSAGHWSVQNDTDHAAIGIVAVVQVGNRLRVDFDRDYTHAGVVQVTSDDDFADLVTAHAGLGKSSALVTVFVRGVAIDPSTVRQYVPGDSGNFWISVSMVNK